MIQIIKQTLKNRVFEYFQLDSLNVVVEEPKRGTADLAIPLFALVKQ